MVRDKLGETSVLVAEVTGATPLAEKLGAGEAARAVERAIARAERSVQAFSGNRLPAEHGRLTARFPRSDSAALAANDMIKRISQLPPVSGINLAVRVVLHAGSTPGQPLGREDMELALSLLPFASPGQILVSNEAVAQFSEGMRANITSSTQVSVNTGGLEMPLLELQPGNLQGLHALGPLTVPPPQPSVMPSSKPRPVPTAAAPEGETGRTRLMLRYLGNSMLVSEHKPILLAGREEANDLVVTDRRASRQHARIELRRGRFVLVDSSTNGTYLLDEQGVEVLLKRGECELPSHGRIGFGYSPLEAGCEPMVFDIGERQ